MCAVSSHDLPPSHNMQGTERGFSLVLQVWNVLDFPGSGPRCVCGWVNCRVCLLWSHRTRTTESVTDHSPKKRWVSIPAIQSYRGQKARIALLRFLQLCLCVVDIGLRNNTYGWLRLSQRYRQLYISDWRKDLGLGILLVRKREIRSTAQACRCIPAMYHLRR